MLFSFRVLIFDLCHIFHPSIRQFYQENQKSDLEVQEHSFEDWPLWSFRESYRRLSYFTKGIIQDQTLPWTDKEFGKTGRHGTKWWPDISVAFSILAEVLLWCVLDGGMVMSFSIEWIGILGESWTSHAFLLLLCMLRCQKLSPS